MVTSDLDYLSVSGKSFGLENVVIVLANHKKHMDGLTTILESILTDQNVW